MSTKAPNSRRNLDRAIERIHGRESYLRIRTAMANTVAAQMMPEGVVKGGTAMKLRFGDVGTRFSEDLDAARVASLDEFVSGYERRLAEGWAGFAGRLVELAPAHPRGVPEPYVMRPYLIRLSYLGASWVSVPLEVGHDEIGDADEPDWGLDDSIASYFELIGLSRPRPVPIMALHHQVAQKIHALTAPGSRRVHDLVDLQIMVRDGEVDYPATRRTCVRLFDYRHTHAWPPEVVVGDNWDAVYAEERRGTSTLEDLDEAVAWANDLVARLDSSEA